MAVDHGPVVRAPSSRTIELEGTYPMNVVRAPVADTNSSIVTATFIRCPVV